jgi:geranylgeranyl diphosphate synthase, type II
MVLNKIKNISVLKKIERLKNNIEKSILDSVDQLGEKSPLLDACHYCLTNGGKRLRPLIVLLIAEALGKEYDVMNSALSVEYFHTASLIADDLPCMDDEKTRRNKPALHIKFNQSTALLASYTLISAGYEMICKNAKVLSKHLKDKDMANRACMIAMDEITTNAKKATTGQYFDLFPSEKTDKMILKVIHQKTETLFEIAFVLGWIFGGGDLSLLEDVKQAARSFGKAFQIADDIGDIHQDDANESGINIVTNLGLDKAIELFNNEITNLKIKLDSLKIKTPSFLCLIDLLEKTIKQYKKQEA